MLDMATGGNAGNVINAVNWFFKTIDIGPELTAEEEMVLSFAMMSGGVSFGGGGGQINAIPGRVSRVIPTRFLSGGKLAASNLKEAFVTAADDVAKITNSKNLAKRLALIDKSDNYLQGPL